MRNDKSHIIYIVIILFLVAGIYVYSYRSEKDGYEAGYEAGFEDGYNEAYENLSE